MKTTRIIPVLIVATSLLLGACSGIGYTAAPAAASSAVAVSSSASGQTLPSSVTAPLANASDPVASASTQWTDLQNAYEAIYQAVNPSVVTIDVSSAVSSGRFRGNSQGQVVPTAEGSGFIWDGAGRIVTNNHVVDGAARLSVVFSDGSTYDARLVGADPSHDLAVIQVTGAPASLLKPISVGDSSQVKVGQMVVAIGNPFGLANTLTQGIVSAVGRSIQSDASGSRSPFSQSQGSKITDIIQTDAAINPGNSGGVLLDMSGKLIGVPSQIASDSGSNSGVGFAIPSATVLQVVPALIKTGSAPQS